MKNLIYVAMIAVLAAFMSFSGYADGFKKEAFNQVIYLEHGGKGDLSGRSADNAKAISTGDLYAIPADAVIEKVYVLVDTAVVGLTSLDVGDDDTADGYCASAKITLGTPGGYCLDEDDRGAYGRDAGASANRLKYYSAAGKEVKAAVNGPSSAGKMRVVVQGFLL